MSYIYAIFVQPIEDILRNILILSTGIAGDAVLAILCLSFSFNLLLIPFYYLAERIQKQEFTVQQKMRNKKSEIKKAFVGYERYLVLNELYRKHGYKKIYALRSVVPLMIQLPVFFAAYKMLGAYDFSSTATNLLPINLSKPDELLSGLNLLPVIMVLVNIVSIMFYSHVLTFEQQVNGYILAGVFFVILYASPSSLVIYWIFNNAFGLLKNIILHLKNKSEVTRSKKIVGGLL
ncbi:YidC/Oxa1 family membrane protein insertase [Microbulbifer sp.]|uniref:YidC/Oxa1 family membrane protein insertase n=1 Tax=Microbulbifer sp. TaxID=1908541 RepID=UPI0025879683|nr:YidC/Oxa1 family membrane protein insertase [Microbulbifer sp.]